MEIFSPYMSFYDLNISDHHPDINLVSGAYCYATIPAQNATLTRIREVNNIALSSSGGSVTVSISRNEDAIIRLRVNSTSTPTLTVSLSGLVAGDRYQVTMDSTVVHDRIYASPNGTMTFSVDGPWSSHELSIIDMNPMRQFGPMSYWILMIGVPAGLIAIIVVAIGSRIRR
jgi:hypothetical protein